jgi:hypothetical protein
MVLSIVETDATFHLSEVHGIQVWVGKCIFCQVRLSVPREGEAGPGVTIEHLVPRHHGGSDEPENLALACAACNGEKGRRHDHRPQDDARRLEVTRALLERRKARWPATARAPRWPRVGDGLDEPLAPVAPDPGAREGAAGISVTGIVIYPIKSTGGITLDEAAVTDRGFALDRRFVLLDDRGNFLSQRAHPRLCLVTPALASDHLVLSAPGRAPLEVPLHPDPSAPRVQARVWGDDCEGVEVVGAGAWFRDLVGGPCRLVFQPDDAERLVDLDYARRGELVSFADGFPFLLASEDSLAELNGRLDSPVPMDRFRPNIIVRGHEPYAEDEWKHLRIGGIAFEACKPCARCVMITVDQATGVPSPEPLRTLAGYRKQGKKVLFGQNLLAHGRGTVRRGDRVEVG